DVGGDDPSAVAGQQQCLDAAAGADVGGHVDLVSRGQVHQGPSRPTEAEHVLAAEGLRGDECAVIGHQVEVLVPGAEAARHTHRQVIGGESERGDRLACLDVDQPRLGGGVHGLAQHLPNVCDSDAAVEV